jgi:hypothetical protein
MAYYLPWLSNGTVQSGIGLGLNFSLAGYYSQSLPYINRVKSAGGWMGEGYANATDWPTNVPNNASVKKYMWNVSRSGRNICKPGTYRIRWTSTGQFTPSMPDTTTGFINPASFAIDTSTSGGGTAHFTMSEPSDGEIQWYLSLQNVSGGSASITDLVVMHDDHVTAYDGGEIFDPEFIAAVPPNLSFLRFLGGTTWNNCQFTAAETYTEAHCSWTAPIYDWYYGMPWTVMAKLCAKLGCDMWLPMPTASSGSVSFTVDTGANTITIVDADNQTGTRAQNGYKFSMWAGYGADGVAPGGTALWTTYYLINKSGATFKLSTTLGGSPLTLTSVPSTYPPCIIHNPDGPTAIAADAAANIASVTGFTGRVYVECDNECWDFGRSAWVYLTQALCLDIHTYDENGTDLGTGQYSGFNCMASAQMDISLRLWKEFRAVFARARVAQVICSQWGRAGAGLPSMFEYKDDNGYISSGQRIKAILDSTYDYVSGAPYWEFSEDVADPPAWRDAPYYNYGEYVYTEYRSYNPGAQNDAWWATRLANGVDIAVFYGTLFKQVVDGKMGAGFPITCYEGGPSFYYNLVNSLHTATIDTGTNTLAFGASVTSYYTDGDQVYFSSSVPSTGLTNPPLGSTTPTSCYLRMKDSTHMWLYNTQALYAADTVPNGTGAANLNGTAPGSYGLQNYTRCKAFGDKVFSWIYSSAATTQHEDAYNRIHVTLGLKHFNTFIMFGSWGAGLPYESYNWTWGLRPNQYAAKPDRQTWMETL